MSVYAESSAVLAWLLGEDQGRRTEQELAAADLVVTSDLTLIECDRVLGRSAALGERNAAEAAKRRATLGTASEHWVVLAIDSEVAARSRQAFPREPVRSLDAIHLSTALVARNLVAELQVLSLDGRVRENAAALGFVIAPAD